MIFFVENEVLRLMQCEEQGVTPSESSVESDAEPEPDILSGMRGMLNAVSAAES